jgi:hypothetical protein
LHHPVPVPQELPQIPVFPTGYPDLGKITREQEVQNMQCILTIRLSLSLTTERAFCRFLAISYA